MENREGREVTRVLRCSASCGHRRRLWLKGKKIHPSASHIMSIDGGQPLTILRIKRKRNEEPVDALIFSDSKRRKKGLDVFHFVQTVEREDSWNTKDFQVCLLSSSSFPVLNATRNESLRLQKQYQKKATLRPPHPHQPSLARIRPPQRLILSSSNSPLLRNDHRTRPQKLSHTRNF